MTVPRDVPGLAGTQPVSLPCPPQPHELQRRVNDDPKGHRLVKHSRAERIPVRNGRAERSWESPQVGSRVRWDLLERGGQSGREDCGCAAGCVGGWRSGERLRDIVLLRRWLSWPRPDSIWKEREEENRTDVATSVCAGREYPTGLAVPSLLPTHKAPWASSSGHSPPCSQPTRLPSSSWIPAGVQWAI